MRRVVILALLASVCLPGCDFSDWAASQPAVAPGTPSSIIYTSADGTGAWHIRGNRFWSGAPAELRVAPLSDAQPSLTWSRVAEAECVSLDGVMTFGAPNSMRKGLQFRCGATRLRVTDCTPSEDCTDALIEAIWRTGVEPNYSEVPVNYFYNRCRGIQSITFSLDRPVKVNFGSTLELRQGLGLLAQPDAPICLRDPALGLYRSRNG